MTFKESSKKLKQLRKLITLVSNNDPRITEITLKNHPLSCSMATSLAMALIGNTYVEVLFLESNHLTFAGAQVLASAIAKNDCLEHVWLHNNKIGSDGAMALATALHRNQSVTTLGLGKNNIDSRGAEALLEAVRVNSSITGLFLEGNEAIGDDLLLRKINTCVQRNVRRKTRVGTVINNRMRSGRRASNRVISEFEHSGDSEEYSNQERHQDQRGHSSNERTEPKTFYDLNNESNSGINHEPGKSEHNKSARSGHKHNYHHRMNMGLKSIIGKSITFPNGNEEETITTASTISSIDSCQDFLEDNDIQQRQKDQTRRGVNLDKWHHVQQPCLDGLKMVEEGTERLDMKRRWTIDRTDNPCPHENENSAVRRWTIPPPMKVPPPPPKTKLRLTRASNNANYQDDTFARSYGDDNRGCNNIARLVPPPPPRSNSHPKARTPAQNQTSQRSTFLPTLHSSPSLSSPQELQELISKVAKNDPLTTEIIVKSHILSSTAMSLLADALCTNTHVQVLFLQNNSMSGASAQMLASSFGKNSTLEHVWLGNNCIGTNGAIAIAKSLFENNTLRTLGLNENNISNDGALAILDAMKVNTSLTGVFLHGNDGRNDNGDFDGIDEHILERIHHYATRNASLITNNEDRCHQHSRCFDLLRKCQAKDFSKEKRYGRSHRRERSEESPKARLSNRRHLSHSCTDIKEYHENCNHCRRRSIDSRDADSNVSNNCHFHEGKHVNSRHRPSDNFNCQGKYCDSGYYLQSCGYDISDPEESSEEEEEEEEVEEEEDTVGDFVLSHSLQATHLESINEVDDELCDDDEETSFWNDSCSVANDDDSDSANNIRVILPSSFDNYHVTTKNSTKYVRNSIRDSFSSSSTGTPKLSELLK